VRLVVGVLLAVCLPAVCTADEDWTLVDSAHFQVYSQTGEQDARSLALWLEQLRAFALTTSTIKPDQKLQVPDSVHVIEFRSEKEYSLFRFRSIADAYFVGGQSGDYIVLPRSGSKDLSLTAHEYAHVVFHSLGYACIFGDTCIAIAQVRICDAELDSASPLFLCFETIVPSQGNVS